MKSLLVKASNWKFILPAFLVCAICIYFFQNAVTAMSEIIGEETKLIDMRSDYDLAEINTFFTGLKEEGRAIHKNATKITDMIFPFGYGALFILLSAFFLKKIAGEKSNWLSLSLIPIVLMMVDYKENFKYAELIGSVSKSDG